MPRKYQKKAPRRRYPMRRRRQPLVRKYNRGGHIKELAAAQYTTGNQLLLPAIAPGGGTYQFANFSLAAASARVKAIASSYQEFRIKKVTWQVKPFFDTFAAPGSATAPTVPHLYWRVDKLGSFSADATLNTLKSTGCKPIRLDDKMITKSFKPAVLQAVAMEATPNGQPASANLVLGSYKVSPWLPTNANAYEAANLAWEPSSIDHLGLLIAIDCDVIPFASVASINFTVEFEFRKPLQDDPSSTTSVLPIKLETLAPGYVPPVEEAKTA